jgi:hypothetical protein
MENDNHADQGTGSRFFKVDESSSKDGAAVASSWNLLLPGSWPQLHRQASSSSTKPVTTSTAPSRIPSGLDKPERSQLYLKD